MKSRDEVEAMLRARLNEPPPPPLEAASSFFRSFFSDADGIKEVEEEISRSISINPRFVLKGLAGIEGLLADPPAESGTLSYLVAWEANWVLDDESDEGAKEWLHEVAEMIRDILGENQPPRREAVTTIQH